MNNNRIIYYYIASCLSILVPVPGRFAYGIILLFLFNLQMLFASLIFHAVEHLSLQILRNSIIAFALIATTVLYKQLLIIYCPIMALTLGFCLYLPALTSCVIEFFFSEYKKGVKARAFLTVKRSLLMSALCLLFFLFRDIAGFGTLTLPLWKKMFIIHLPFSTDSVSAASFFATIPGSLVLVSIVLSCYIVFCKKMRLIKNNPSLLKNIEKTAVDSENREIEEETK